MKKVLALVVALLFSTAVVSAAGSSISGGLIMGSHSPEEDVSGSGLGFWLGGTYQVSSMPISLTGSFTTLSSSELEIDGNDYEFDNGASLLKLFAGYQLPMYPIAVGAGVVSQTNSAELRYTNGSKVEVISKNTGLALAAFGTIPVSSKFDVNGQVYFAPIGTLAISVNDIDVDYDSTAFGLELSGAYKLQNQISIEAGLRSSSFSVDDNGVKGEGSISGIFFGAKYSF